MAQSLGSVAAGTVVKLNLNGTPWDFRILHQGNPNPALYDSSCDGTWVCLEKIYSTRAWDSSNNDLKNSDIKVWMNGDFLNMFDPDIRAAIKQVKIPYVNGTGGSAVASGANGLSCKIFLLSGYELGWTKSDNSYFPVDGAKLDYFTAGTSSAANQKRIAKYNGSAAVWWTRSPDMDGSGSVWRVHSGGNCNSWYCYDTGGVRPAFVLPSTLLVSDDGTVSTNEPPTAPGSIDVTGVVSGGTATITLTAATDPDGTVTSYIYERNADGGQWQRVAQVNSLTQTDSVGEGWGTVAYRAAAVDNNDTQGPYITSDTEVVNTGWLLIGGPVSNMGVQSVPFDMELTIGVSGQTDVTGINVLVKMDGAQLYDDSVNQGDTITIPIDTRTMGSGQHEVQVTATKEDYLAANAAYYFTVPSLALPAGGYSQQLEDSSGNPVFPITTARYVVGANGKSVQAEIDEINSSHRGTTGHLQFIDSVLGPASKTYSRTADVAYALQGYAPAGTSNPGGLLCIYAGYTGQLDSFLNATAEELIFNIPTNVIMSLYEYVLDAAPPAETDPTVNFTALAQPKVVTAATNTGNTASSLNDALTAMMKAFPSQNYYAITDAQDAGVTYYVASQATIGQNTTSASVAYVSSANPTTWYQGVQMTFINTSNIAGLFTYLNPPLVASATSANSVSAGSSLNDTLIAMIKAQPTYYRYQMENDSGTLFYVLSSTQLTTDSLTASNVLYCTTGGTYYNGETLNFVPAEFPNPADLTLGNTISWAGQSWIVANVDSTECYLTLANIYSQSVFDAGGSTVYAGSDLANTAMNFQTQQLTAAQLACLKQVSVEGVSAKVFVASYDQMNGGFAWFNSNTRRNLRATYWTSTGFGAIVRVVNVSGSIESTAQSPSTSNGFRPSVCLDLTLLG